MATNFKKPSKKTAIIAAISVVALLTVAITGTVIFLKDKGTTEAAGFETEQANRQENGTVANNNQESQQNVENGVVEGTQPENSANAEGEGENEATAPNTQENAGTPAGATGNATAGNAGTRANNGTTATTNNIQETTITDYQTIVTEPAWRTQDVLWTPIGVRAKLPMVNINAELPDFNVTKTATTKSGENIAKKGEEITYTITATSNKELEGIEIKDVIPEQTEFVSADNEGRPVKSEEVVKGIVWNVDLKEKNSEGLYEKQVKLTVKVSENATGTVTNIAIANGETSNEEKTAIIETSKTSTIKRNGTTVVEPAKVGDEITYTISIKNTGKVDGKTTVKDADLANILADGKATMVGNVSVLKGKEVVSSDKTAENLINGIENVEVPAEGEAKVVFTIKLNKIEGKITNVATIGENPTDPEDVNTVDIKAEKHTEQREVKVGETIKYTITLTNSGNTAGTVTVKDKAPEGTKFTSAKLITADGETEITETTLQSGKNVTVPANGKIEIEVVVTAVAKTSKNTDTTSVTNTAYIKEDPNKPEEPVPSEEIKVANVKATKTSSYEGELKEKSVITYTIELTNVGKADGTVKITDQIPEGTTFVEGSIKVNGEGNYALADLTTNGINVTVAKDNGTAKVTFQVTVNPFEEETKHIVNDKAKKDEEPVNPTDDTAEKEYVNIDVEKIWKDPNGTKHNTITINLLRDEKPVNSIELKNGATKYTFSKLDKYDLNDGHEYTYSVSENEVSGYQVAYGQKEDGTLTITNTIDQETISKSGTKTWKAPEGAELPEITVNLLRDGKEFGRTQTLASGATEYTFDNLDRYDLTDGHEYVYTVSEAEVNGYTSEANGMNLTNTIDQEKTSKSGTKTWKAPEGAELPTITVSLLRNGTPTGETRTLTNGNTEYTFDGLDKYDLSTGHEYIYTVSETGAEGTYDTEVDGMNLINTIKQETISKSGTKTWKAPEGAELPTITVSLLRNGTPTGETRTLTSGNTKYTFDGLDKYDLSTGHEYVYTVSETGAEGTYDTEVDGMNLINTIKQETISKSGTKTWKAPSNATIPEITVSLLRDGTATGETRTLSNRENTTYTFDNLDRYDLTDGHEYVYTVSETGAEEAFTTEVDGMNLTNTIKQDTVSKSGTKTWKAPEGAVHPTITISLLRDGTATGETRTLSNGHNEYTFTGLAKYDLTDGHEYVYTVSETGAEGTYDTEVDGMNLINTIKQEKTSKSGTKTWKAPEGAELPTITVSLLRNGTPTGETRTLTSGNTEYTFDGLDKYDLSTGHEYIYTVSETGAEGTYDTEVDGMNLTNTIKQEKTSKSGTKTWKAPEGAELPTITVSLLRNGTPTGETRILTSGNTEYTFDGLDKYDLSTGHEYIYTVSETGAEEAFTTEVDGMNLTNTIKQDETSVSVEKIWNDPYTTHPSIAIQLLRNNQAFGEPVTLTNKTEYTFTKLEKYDLSTGHEYEYTVREMFEDGVLAVDGYQTPVYGQKEDGTLTITNTIIQEKISVNVEKIWKGPVETRSPITVKLLRDTDEFVTSTVLTSDTTYTFPNLDKYAPDGHIYNYYVRETAEDGVSGVSGYQTPVYGQKEDGTLTITNTINPGTTSVSGTKTWNVPEGTTEYPPIKINLFKNGTLETSTQLTDGATEYTFPGLVEYDENGEKYKYTVTETPVTGYISEQDGFNFTNTKIVPEIEVTKVISAVNGTPVTAADNIGSDEAKLNKDAIITYTITTKNTGNTTLSEVKIFDDKKVDLIEATLPTRLQNLTDEQGNPTPVVIELRNGITANTNLLGRDDLTLEPNEEIVLKVSYQLQKEDVLGGKDFVNTAKAVGKYDNKSYNDDDDATVKTEFVPDKVSKTAEKIWDDKNYESNRPTEIKVQLMKNGNPEGTKVTLNENNGWKYTWAQLPEEDAKGTAIDYSVVEDALADYTTSYGKKADGTMTITNTYKKPVSQEGQITITRNETSPQTIQVPMDVVFILDTSGSMVQGDSNNRAKNMVEAVNKTATTILGYNDYNRISVVGFSGSYEGKHQNSTDVTTLLSLGRYTAKSSSGKGANKVNNYLNLTTSGSGNNRYGELTTNVNGTSASRYVNGGTYTQIGIAEGAKQLISASDKTVTLDDGTVVKRIPVIILLSDGEPTYYTTNYNEVTSTGRTGKGGSSTAEYGYNTVLSANYYKNRVTAQYGKTAMMYTIGMGISQRNSNNPGNDLYERLVLDPSGQNVTDAKATENYYGHQYPKYEKPNTLITLLENDKNGYANNYSYADKAYFGEMDASELTAKMQESINASIPKTTRRAITSEEIKNAKVVLTNINKEGEFTLTDGVTTYSSFSSAQAAGVIAGNDTTGYYIDLTKVSAGSIVRVSYTS